MKNCDVYGHLVHECVSIKDGDGPHSNSVGNKLGAPRQWERGPVLQHKWTLPLGYLIPACRIDSMRF